MSGLSVLLQKLKLWPIRFKLAVNLEGMSPFSTSSAFSPITSGHGALCYVSHTHAWCSAFSRRETLKTLAFICATISHHQRAVVVSHPLSYPDDTLAAFALLNSFPVSPLLQKTPAASSVCSSDRQLKMSSCNINTRHKRRHY